MYLSAHCTLRLLAGGRDHCGSLSALDAVMVEQARCDDFESGEPAERAVLFFRTNQSGGREFPLLARLVFDNVSRHRTRRDS